MKQLISILIIIWIYSTSQAQTISTFKDDSIALVQKRTLLQLQKENAVLQKFFDDQPLEQDKQKDADEIVKFNANIAKVKAQKDLLGSDKPTPLSGNITIDKGEVSMAETRALVFKKLDGILGRFNNEIDKIIPCYQLDSSGKPTTSPNPATVVIYNSVYYQAFSDYKALLFELSLLTTKYTNEEANIQSSAANSPIPAIALGSQILNVILNAATLFRTETQFLVNDETITEDVLVSIIRKKDNCSSHKYFYPSLYLPSTSTSSDLLNSLEALEKAKQTLSLTVIQKTKDRTSLNENLQKTVDIEQKRVDSLTIVKKEKAKLLANTQRQSVRDALNSQIAALDSIITDSKDIISSTTKSIKNNLSFISRIQSDQAILDKIYSAMIESLSKSGGENSISSLRNFLRVEKILNEVSKTSTYTLRIVADATGTNRIRKFLWGTTLKHSAGIEASYQLFDNQGTLVNASSEFQYDKYKSSSKIYKGQ